MSYRKLKSLIHKASVDAAEEMRITRRVQSHFIFYRNDVPIDITEDMLEQTGMDYGSGRHRSIFGDFLRELADVIHADTYLHYAEAWMLNEKLESSEAIEKVIKEYKMGDISRHPKRVEVINYVVEDKTGNQLRGVQSIIRPSLGDPSLDDDLTIDRLEMQGRFVGMFKRE